MVGGRHWLTKFVGRTCLTNLPFASFQPVSYDVARIAATRRLTQILPKAKGTRLKYDTL